VVDFRSGWALCCCCRYAFAQIKQLLLTLCFRTEQSFLGASGQQDVGHEGVITGRDVFSLLSSIANPQGVAQPPLQSTYLHSRRLNKSHPQLLVMNHFYLDLLMFSVVTTTIKPGRN